MVDRTIMVVEADISKLGMNKCSSKMDERRRELDLVL